MKKKIILFIIILLLIGAGAFAVFNFSKNAEDDNKDVETIGEDIIIDLLSNMDMDEYELEDLILKDVQVFVGDGKDYFQATLLCENAREKLNLEIDLYNKEGKKVDTLNFELLDILENDERNLFCFVDKDLFDSYSFKVKIKQWKDENIGLH